LSTRPTGHQYLSMREVPAVSRPVPHASTNTGARWVASTTSMATAIWCARARRWKTTRRPRS